jgi:2-amino-4-hydroxy-6-hydroxymethyldihydropteridine diphosphokinase
MNDIDAYIAVGSNIEPQENIPRALLELKTSQHIIAVSNFYKSTAVGRTNQPDFYNGVVKIQTPISPRQLKFDILREIENHLGRVRTSDKNAPRTIDLDLIIYGTLIIDELDIKIPDPAINIYPFVAVPLLELAPNMTLPCAKQKNNLHLLAEFTDRLKSLIFHS